MEKMEGKSGEVGGEREGSLGEKLMRGALVGRKCGPCTPVLSWRLSAPHYKIINQKPFPNTVSARKLGAALWEFGPYVSHIQMNTGFGNGVTAGAASSRRHRSCHPSHKEKGVDLSHFPGHAHPSSTSAEQPARASRLQEDVATSVTQHRRSNERVEQKISHTLQPESPPCCYSSMEVAPYDPGFISSSRIIGRIGESHYGLKTSTQLLKVLNRIWSLEEQQVSNIALIKALKVELDHTLANINGLIQQRNAEQIEIDDLIKQFAEDKLVRKNKERNLIEAAIKTAKAELDDERKLRKQSESMHRKFACNLSDVKSSLSNTLKDLEKEKTARALLEELCDEFARGIKDYEQEMHHASKQMSDKTCLGRIGHGCLILHISELWLVERMQAQNDPQSGRMDKCSTAEKLYFEIESYLQHKNKHINADTICGNLLPLGSRSSMESISFNEVLSVPRVVAGDNEDPKDSDELNKPSRDDNFTPDGNGSMKLNGWKGKLRSRTPSSLQVKFEEQMAWAMSNAGNDKSSDVNRAGVISHNSEHLAGAKDGDEGNNMLYRLVSNHGRNEQSGSAGNTHPLNNYGETGCCNKGWRHQASPIRQWEVKAPEAGVLGSSSKVSPRLEENTLKPKLLAALMRRNHE